MELETASVQTAGPVETPKVVKSEKETVLLEPTQEEPKAQEEPKPIVLELSKAEDADATEPAVISESPNPTETTPITSGSGAATSESLEKTTTEATEPSGTESTVKAAEPQATAVEAVASDSVDSTAAQTAGAEPANSEAAATTTRPPVPQVDDDESDDDLDDLDGTRVPPSPSDFANSWLKTCLMSSTYPRHKLLPRPTLARLRPEPQRNQ